MTSRLHQISGHQPKFAPANGSSACGGSATKVAHGEQDCQPATLLAVAGQLPALGEAPRFTDTEDWFNTPGERPLTLASLRGGVVLVDFWTYTCINCIRTLPYLKAWDATYRRDGLTIVGVETPEFAFEHDASNVANAISQFGIRYPVVQDNEMGTWNAYGNEDWPADYLIDARGQVRYRAAGEGDYGQTETAIRALLAEAGHEVTAKSRPTGVIVPSELATPETYLGTARAQGWINGPGGGLHDYGPAPTQGLQLNQFAYSGIWTIGEQPAQAGAGAGIDLQVRRKGCLPRAQLARRTSAAGAGAAGWPPDLGGRRGVGRPWRGGDGPPPAAVHARLAAQRRTAPPEPALRARRHGLRLYVRLAPVAAPSAIFVCCEAVKGPYGCIACAAPTQPWSGPARPRSMDTEEEIG